MRPGRQEVSDFLTLNEVAAALGVHRATVNDMVLNRRLRARRRRGHWLVDRTEFTNFAATYQRPPNAPPRRNSRSLVSENGWQVLALLVEWSEGSVAEIDRGLDLHEGNIRKQLRLLESEGLVCRDANGSWSPTAAGQQAAAGVDRMAG